MNLKKPLVYYLDDEPVAIPIGTKNKCYHRDQIENEEYEHWRNKASSDTFYANISIIFPKSDAKEDEKVHFINHKLHVPAAKLHTKARGSLDTKQILSDWKTAYLLGTLFCVYIYIII